MQNKLKNVCDLKILVDDVRFERFQKNPPILNGEKIDLDYILPSDSGKADLIIVATKASGFRLCYFKY